MVLNEGGVSSRKFAPPAFGEGRGADLAPATLNVNALEGSQGGRTPGENFASLTSSQFPKTPARRGSAASKGSRAGGPAARFASKKPGKGEPKERYFKDRAPILKELAKLKAAEDATWAPYAMLRPALPETALFSYVKPKKKREQQGGGASSPDTQKRTSIEPQSSHRLSATDTITTLPAPANLTSTSSRQTAITETSPTKQASFKLVDGKLVRSGEEPPPPEAKEWELDPAANREGKFDLRLDDPRLVVSPTWARCAALRQLVVLADAGDEEVINAAIRCLGDTEGVVRVEALHVLRALGAKGDKRIVKPVVALTKDRDANVRAGVCHALQVLTDPGIAPSRAHPATGTSQDVTLLKRDKTVIDALQPLLDDDMGHVRSAAATALDKVNGGWQNFKLTEERWDDSLKSPRQRRPLPSERVQSTMEPMDRIWNRKYTYDDLLPDLKHKGEAPRGTVELVGKQRGHDQRYLTLAGYKHRSYSDALRQERVVARFEREQQRAATKVQLERQMVPETEGRKITTEWMGIEWVDRSKRTHLGRTLHPFGAGVEPARDSVAAPYNEGYNGFSVPLGYSYI